MYRVCSLRNKRKAATVQGKEAAYEARQLQRSYLTQGSGVFLPEKYHDLIFIFKIYTEDRK